MIENNEDKKFLEKLTYAQGIALIELFSALGVPSRVWKEATTLFILSFQKALREDLKDGNRGKEN
jgi:hypothetical protein